MYDGPYVIRGIIRTNAYAIEDLEGSYIGAYNSRQIRPHREPQHKPVAEEREEILGEGQVRMLRAIKPGEKLDAVFRERHELQSTTQFLKKHKGKNGTYREKNPMTGDKTEKSHINTYLRSINQKGESIGQKGESNSYPEKEKEDISIKECETWNIERYQRELKKQGKEDIYRLERFNDRLPIYGGKRGIYNHLTRQFREINQDWPKDDSGLERLVTSSQEEIESANKKQRRNQTRDAEYTNALEEEIVEHSNGEKHSYNMEAEGKTVRHFELRPEPESI